MIRALAIVLAIVAVSCGERTSAADVEQISASLADVMVAVQRGADSTSRARIADSVARKHGYGGWDDLRSAISDVTVEPERLRTVLDSTQSRIEKRSR